MFRHLLRVVFVLLAVLPLAAFRMPAGDQASDKLLYDVRGAFVTAKPNVPQGLVIAVDMLVDEAIRSTVRKTMLPRTILSVRIEEASHAQLFVGTRHEARVKIKAISVASGEPIAEGSFKVSIFLFDGGSADKALAEKVADRIATEFRLDGQGGRPTIASALFP